jgi:hypothetical protein
MPSSRRFSRLDPTLWRGPSLRKSFALLVLTWLVTVLAASAQNQAPGTLQGVVTVTGSEGNVLPAQRVALHVAGTRPGAFSFTATTSDTGAYTIEHIPPGRYVLTASAPGFNAKTIKLSVQAGQTTLEDIRLQIAVLRQRVEVHATVPLTAASHISPPAKLTANQVVTVPVPEQKTQAMLPLLPGVIRTPEGETYIEGMNESSGMFKIDQAETVDPVTGAFIVDLPVDAIDTLQVDEAPFLASEGGFVGALTTASTKAPLPAWHFNLGDMFPHVFAERGQLVGAKVFEPRVYITGPLLAGKLNFSEAFAYDLNRDNVRGLPWPNNVTTTTGVNSYTTLQALFSDRHALTGHLQFFPLRQANANIDALIPKPASENYGQRGYSIAGTDRFSEPSGIAFTTMFHFLGVHNYSRAQGRLDMLVTPIGFGGDYFNDWTRSSSEEETAESIFLPQGHWFGSHNLTFGAYANYRAYHGTNISRPIQILAGDNSVVESIGFTGGNLLRASAGEFSGFGSDRWSLNSRLALNLGFRGTTQSEGRSFAPAPRIGLIFTPDKQGKTIVRAGVGLFYERFPLLAADFASNPDRVVTLFGANGLPALARATFINRCAETAGLGLEMLPDCSDFNTTPYSETWRVEMARQITRKFRARIGYLSSLTRDNFVVNPATVDSSSAMLLANNGSSQYREFRAGLDFAPNAQTHIYATYVHSQSRGDVNSLSQLFGTCWQPVIQPDVFANLPSYVPNRFTALGTFALPWKITFDPSIDVHSGFPYSDFSVLQNYVGVPDSLRFPAYFSFDFSVYREFRAPIFKRRRIRIGIFSLNTTDRRNPTAVYSDTASPFFGDFTGPEKRVDGVIFDIIH